MKGNVILFSYNRPGMLKEAVDSVLTQSHEDLTLWLYDDYSDFDIERWVKQNRYDQDPRLVICKADRVSIEERIRPGSTRWPENINHIVQQIPRHQFITYLCDDDVLDRDWCARVSRGLTDSPTSHMILGDMYYYYDGQDPYKEAIKGFPADIEVEDGRFLMWWNLGAFAYRSDCSRDCKVRWGEGIEGYAHSWDISLIESMKAAHVGYIFFPDPAVYRREHENTLSARMGRINEKGLYYKAAEEMLPQHVMGLLE